MFTFIYSLVQLYIYHEAIKSILASCFYKGFWPSHLVKPLHFLFPAVHTLYTPLEAILEQHLSCIHTCTPINMLTYSLCTLTKFVIYSKTSFLAS